ncbi:MAG: hypothetical protein ABW171_14610 [Steroidobacter sp.]
MDNRTARIVVLAAMALPSLTFAGTYVESVATNHLSPQTQSQSMQLWVGTGRFRMEMQGGQAVQIFRDKAFYTLSPATRSYSKLDKAALERLMQQANEANKGLEAMLPPEQRGKTKQTQSAPKVERSVKPTSRTEASALGQQCKVWEVFANASKVQEMCVVDIATLPNGKELVATMEQVSEAFKGTAAGAGTADVWENVKATNGYPVITRTYVNGKLLQEVKATTIRSAPTPDSLFEIPAGFQQRKVGESG